ncbi:MAG: tetratricopeptide repeat protein [Rikenellaceae bacterium]
MLNNKKILVFLVVAITLILSPELFSQNSQKDSSKKGTTAKIISSKYPETSRKITDYYLHAIYELHQNYDTVATFKYLEKTYALDSLHAPTLFLIGSLTSDFDKAIRAIEKAVEVDNENMEYKFFLSSLYGSSEQYIKSINLINDIHSRGGHNANTYRYLTALYDVIGDNNMATRTIDSAMVMYGSNPEIVSFKGDLLLRANKTVAYVSNCEDLDRLVPESVIAKHKLGMAYGMIGKDSLAYETLQKAYELDSTYTPLLGDLAAYYANIRSGEIFKCLNMLFQDKEVTFIQKRNYFNEVIRNDFYYSNYGVEISRLINILRKTYDYDYDAESMYSAHLIAMGSDSSALEVQRKFVFNDKVSVDNQMAACNTLISAYLYRENPDSVSRYIYVAIEKFHDNPDELLYISYVLGRMEMYDEAIKHLNTYVKQQKTDSLKSVFYGSIGDTYYMNDNKKSAYKSYKKSLKYDPDNIMVLNNYSYYLSLDLTDLETALDMSKRVITKEPLNGTYLDTYAWILHLLGRHDEAKTYQLKAIAQTNEDNPELFFHYAEILAALGENLNARRYYRKALESGANQELIDERLGNLKY